MTPQQRDAFKKLTAAVDRLEAAEQKLSDDAPAIPAAKAKWDEALAAADEVRAVYYAALVQGNVVDLQAITDAQVALAKAKQDFNAAPGPAFLT